MSQRRRFGLEVGRFLAVGLLATIVALILFNLLVHGFGAGIAPLNDRPEVAYVVANAVGMVISFRGNKHWAFRDRRSRHADGGVIAFVVINLATMLIPITCLWISRGVGLDDPVSDNISANVVGLLLANAARFFLFRGFVFHRVHPDVHVLEAVMAAAVTPAVIPAVTPAVTPTETSTTGPAAPTVPEAAAS